MSKSKGAGRLFWRGFWRAVGSLVGLVKDARREYRSGKRGPARSTKTVASTKGRGGQRGGRGGGGFTPVDGRSVDDIRASGRRADPADGWTVETVRPRWFGRTDAEDDPWMAEMQAKHGVDRWGQPIQGHPRWDTPEGQAELSAALAEQAEADPSSAAGGGV